MSAYNIGISGHTIYRCVDNVEDAISYFNPTDFLIIETNKVYLELSEMEAVIDGTAVRESASAGGTLMRL